MKKIFKAGVSAALVLALGAGLASCQSNNPANQGGTYTPTYQAPNITVPSYEAKTPTYADNTELKMAVAHNSADTTITFSANNIKTITDKKLTMADGKTYAAGDLKPTWQALSDTLKIKFNNVYSGGTSADNEYTVWQSKSFEGADVIVGNASKMVVDGKAGLLVNIADYLEYMPNFVKFLQDNPIVYLSMINDTETGAMYYTPYFDGFDDIENYFLCRTDWVVKLLDGSSAYTAEKSDTFGDICKEVSYTPFMPTSGSVQVDVVKKDGSGTEKVTKKYDGTTYGNIVKYMNDHAEDATTGVELVNWLRSYIDEAYNGYYGTNRSDLFIGQNAAWDADELAALLRCICTNSYKLSGQDTVKVNGLFGREYTLQRWSNLFSMTGHLFGVRGTESRNGYLYFDSNGNVQDARADVEFNEAFAKMHELYSEGLVMSNFWDTTKSSTKPVEDCLKNNLGFMEYDYVQTQTIFNNDTNYATYGLNGGNNGGATVGGADYAGEFTAIMTPVSKWHDGTNINKTTQKDEGVYMRFTESWRSVKTSGWCISAKCTGEKLMAAIRMFDYMYSQEGQDLMSFGPEAWRDGTNTINYKGKTAIKINEKTSNELWTLAKGNYTDYARKFLGSTLPIGFVKNQAMEYQCTTPEGVKGATLVSNAIGLGTIKHVSPSLNANMWYTIVPTVLPTTAAEDTAIKGFAVLQGSGLYSKEKGKYSIFTDVIRFGYGYDGTLSNTLMPSMPANAQALADFFVLAGENGGNGATYETYQQLAWRRLVTYCNKNSSTAA